MQTSALEELGKHLRQARKALGLSIQDVERATRIRSRYLKALEDGDVELLPSHIQVRGFLRNYSLLVGLDPDDILLRLETARSATRNVFWGYLLRIFRASRVPTPEGNDLPLGARPTPFRFGFGYSSRSRQLRPLLNLGLLIIIVGVLSAFAWARGWNSDTLFVQLDVTVTPEILGPRASPTMLSEIVLTPTNPPPLVSFSDIQLSLVVEQRSFTRVLIDGDIDFEGILKPGERLDYLGAQHVEVTTANGAGIRVIFNQREEGLMGDFGEVVTWRFEPNERAVFTHDPESLVTATPTPGADGAS